MTTVRKPVAPVKAFRATLYDEPGILSKLDGVIYFFGDDGTITEYEPPMAPWTCILGEIGLAETARLLDDWQGGAVSICLHRQQEVQ